MLAAQVAGGRQGRRGAQWSPIRTGDPNRHRSGKGTDPQGATKTGEPVTFRSALVPPYVRKAQWLEAALPWLYLIGVFTGEMSAALEVLVGQEARGLSASTVSRLKRG